MVLRCPSDDVTFRPQPTDSVRTFDYAYSYSMNWYLDGAPYSFVPLKSKGALTRIRRSADKWLLGEMDMRVISGSGGEWFPGKMGTLSRIDTWVATQQLLSIRHDQPSGLSDPLPTTDTWPVINPTRRGNVAFCDGHAEFVSREFAHSQEHVDPQY